MASWSSVWDIFVSVLFLIMFGYFVVFLPMFPIGLLLGVLRFLLLVCFLECVFPLCLFWHTFSVYIMFLGLELLPICLLLILLSQLVVAMPLVCLCVLVLLFVLVFVLLAFVACFDGSVVCSISSNSSRLIHSSLRVLRSGVQFCFAAWHIISVRCWPVGLIDRLFFISWLKYLICFSFGSVKWLIWLIWLLLCVLF